MSRDEPSLAFVIPTRNEAGAIRGVLSRLTGEHPGQGIHFLVVDCGSTDGTVEAVLACGAVDRRIWVLQGPGRGLGPALAHGHRHALEVLNADRVIQLDADGSHDPGTAKALLEALDRGADMAIASRYTQGAWIDPEWPVSRRLLSLGANRLVRTIPELKRIRDATGGYRAFEARALRAAEPSKIQVRRQVWQVALLHRIRVRGYRVAEIPCRFEERRTGRSKLEATALAEGLAWLAHVHWSRAKAWWSDRRR